MFYRELKTELERDFAQKHILVLIGPRQVGKTTLIKSLVADKSCRDFNFDLSEDRDFFSQSSRTKINTLLKSMQEEKQEILFIDEVQKEMEAFNTVKFIYDNFADIKIVLSGSTALELQRGSFETLTGRAVYKKLLGLSPEEIYHQIHNLDQKQQSYQTELKLRGAEDLLKRTIRYGSLPGVYFSEDPEKELDSLANNIVLKDFIISNQNQAKLMHLLKLLALQIGSLISVDELAGLTELSRPTIYEYLEQLEKLFVIHRIEPLDLSERKAISRGFKIYFWDFGLRNYFANDFTDLDQNPNNGVLFENFVVNNFKRKNIYENLKQRIGFFRNKNQAEIDIVIKEDGKETVYECKLSKDADKIHSKLLNKDINCINRYNWVDYL